MRTRRAGRRGRRVRKSDKLKKRFVFQPLVSSGRAHSLAVSLIAIGRELPVLRRDVRGWSIAAGRYACVLQFVFNTLDHPAQFAHVLRAIGVVRAVRLGINRKLRTQRHPLLLGGHVRVHAAHISDFPFIHRAVFGLQDLCNRVKRSFYVLRRDTEMDFIPGKIALAFGTDAVHVNKRICAGQR